jgi:ferritin-like metal-binding protein YciE
MSAKNLSELLIEELRDVYDGEKRLTRALPKMAKAASSEELSDAFTTHLRETEGQIARLEQVFRMLGEAPRGKKCEGIMGIVAEGEQAIEELDEGPVLDAALIAGAQKVEHYEIASYGTVAYFAELLGQNRAKDLLGQTLEEEKAADEKLTTLAEARVNREALVAAGNEERDEFRAVASDRGSRRRSQSRGGSTRRSSRSRSRGKKR